MCRFLVYKGRDMFMSDLLIRAEQSLIQQSFKSREREEPLNGDGFGVGWYAPEIDPTPCVFTSIQPAWSNRNLYRIAEKVKSGLFFAHVRAASPGMAVSELNCHPFQHDRYLWMHNGSIGEFPRIRRRLRESLGDAAYDTIQGNTDSEHAFSVFLDQLAGGGDALSTDGLGATVARTIDRLDAFGREAKIATPSHFNFAVTDGRSLIATRYVSNDAVPPHTLYYALGDRFEVVAGGYRMRPAAGRAEAIIIASEPVSEQRADWIEMPPNHMISVTPELDVRLTPIG